MTVDRTEFFFPYEASRQPVGPPNGQSRSAEPTEPDEAGNEVRIPFVSPPPLIPRVFPGL
jgi:hypothetical protein